MPGDPHINEYGISHSDWDDLGQNEQRDIAHEHGDDWLGEPPPETDGGDDSSQQTTESADTGRPPTFHADTPPTFHSDAQQEAWLADQRAKLWDFHELERKENVQKGRDDWSRSNKEREDRLRSESRDAAADQAREEREKQESRWSTKDEAEGLLQSRDRDRYVDRDMEASKDPNVNVYGISHNDWDDLSQNEQRDVAHSFGDDWHGQLPLTDDSGGSSSRTFHTFEAALVDKGLTPDEVALVRERQGGTITKFDQDDADAVYARRDALVAQAVAEQIEASLLAQGATPEEIALVRERQGGTITKFDQDDADAVYARRDALGAQAVAEQIEASLLAQGATPEEIAYVRERQGGTLKKFDQGDIDAVNARRDALGAQAVAEQIEASLLAQGATPEEIAYVRERQGGTLTKLDRDDVNAVNARRSVLGAQAVAEQVEAALLAQGATPEEIAYVRERQGGTLTKLDRDDVNAVNARRDALRTQAVAEQVEAALVDKGLTPDEIAYVRERQGGTLTQFEQDDADAVNAMRLDQAAYDFHTRNELSALESEEVRAGYFRAIDDDQQRADLWEAEQEMGAAEDVQSMNRDARQIIKGMYPEPPIESIGVGLTPEDVQAMNRDARQITKGMYPEPPIESIEAGFVPHGPPELDQVAQTIYALAFPGRSPEEIAAAARDLYPSRASFDREAIARAKLNTRNDPAQSALVDEFAISSGYQPLELDMSPEAVNERRKRVILGTAALWTLPATVSWGALASGFAGAGIGAVAQAVAPADGEKLFELTSADPMRAAHGVGEGFGLGYGGQVLGGKMLSLAGKYVPKVVGSLPGRWGAEAAGGAVSDTGWALRDGRITRNEALYEIGGGAVLSPAFDVAVRGAGGVAQVGRQTGRIVLPTQITIPKTGLTVPLGGGFVPLTTPAPRVPHLTVVRQGQEGQAISGEVFDRMALTGEYEGVIGNTAVSFKPGRMSEALHQANPDLPLYYSATPVGKIISEGPIAMDKPDLGPSEQYFFASPGDVNPKFMGGSAFGGSGNTPGIFAYSPLDAEAVGSGFERVMSSPDTVKFYSGGYEAERGIHSGQQIPPAERAATAGVRGGQLYLGASVNPPSFSQRLQANVNAIMDTVRGEQRGQFVFRKATPEELADRIEADQTAARQTWEESLASGKVDPEDRAGFMDAAYRRTLDDIAEEQTLMDRALAAQADLEDMLRQNGGTSAERARLERVQGYLGQRSLRPVLPVDMETGGEREILTLDDSRRTIEDPRGPLAPPGRVSAEGRTSPPEPLRELPGGLTPEDPRDLPGGLTPRETCRAGLPPDPLRDLPGGLPPDPLRDLPGGLPPDPLRDLPGGLPPDPLRELPGGPPPEDLRELPGGLPPEDLRELPGGPPPEDLRELPGGRPPEPPNNRRPRVRVKSIEDELAEGVNPGEHPRVIKIETPPTEVTLHLATGERSIRTLGSNRRFRVVATDPEPVTNASHQGRTAEVGTGPAGRVRAKHIEETRYQPNSVHTHQPTVPRRTGLTPKPPKPPSTKAPKAKGRSKRRAFTASMRR